MLVLRSSPASPFGRKVKMAALELGLMSKIEIVAADTTDPAEVLRQQNPLGKIPTLVLEDSGLARLYHRGGYRPLSLGRAVAQVAWMKKRFDAGGIEVVRMGLQPTGELERALVAGPYHPAFGELVLGRLMLRQARRLLAEAATDGPVTLVIAARDRSIFQGQRSVNLHRLRQLGLAHNLVVRTDADQERQTVRMVAA